MDCEVEWYRTIDQGKLDGGTYYIIFSNSNGRKYFTYLFVYLKRAVVIQHFA